MLLVIHMRLVSYRERHFEYYGCEKAFVVVSVKGTAIPLQALTGPEDSRRLRLPDFKTIDT